MGIVSIGDKLASVLGHPPARGHSETGLYRRHVFDVCRLLGVDVDLSR